MVRNGEATPGIEFQREWVRRAILVLVLGAAILAALSFYGDFGATLRALQAFSWPIFIVALGLAFLNYITRFLRWELYLRELGLNVVRKDSLAVFLSGFLMGMTPARVGEVVKSLMLKQVAEVPVSVSAPVVLVERLTDVLGMILLAAAGSVGLGRGHIILAALLAICVLVVTLLSWRRLGLRVLRFSRVFPFLRRWTTILGELYESSHRLVRLRILVVSTAYSVLAWFFECVGFYLIFRGLAWQLSLSRATFTYAFSTLVGAASMLPGGLGLTEGSLAGLAVLEGVPREIAVSATVLVRLATFWFALILGGLAVYRNRKRFGLMCK